MDDFSCDTPCVFYGPAPVMVLYGATPVEPWPPPPPGRWYPGPPVPPDDSRTRALEERMARLEERMARMEGGRRKPTKGKAS